MTVDALVDDLVDSISLFSQICYGIFADRFVDIDTDAVSLGSHAVFLVIRLRSTSAVTVIFSSGLSDSSSI